MQNADFGIERKGVIPQSTISRHCADMQEFVSGYLVLSIAITPPVWRDRAC